MRKAFGRSNFLADGAVRPQAPRRADRPKKTSAGEITLNRQFEQVNLVLGVISRVSQQMNIFAIGFPITLAVGLLGVLLTLPMMQAPFTMVLEQMLSRFQ